MTSLFADRIAIITGAASGIGLALSRELCARGAVVVMADRDAAGLAAAIASLGGAGLRGSSTVVDVTDAAAVRNLIDGAVARHGRLDYLFNNAGIGVVGDARDLSLEDWRTVVDTSLFGTVHGVAAAYRNIKLIGIDRQHLLHILPGLMAPEHCARKFCAAWSGTSRSSS
jgi:NAD(P)-dependent dehydrogenase (short-subunit alcohol dehydrogenase family)